VGAELPHRYDLHHNHDHAHHHDFGYDHDRAHHHDFVNDYHDLGDVLEHDDHRPSLRSDDNRLGSQSQSAGRVPACP
jgi:hypothetical protein